MVKGGDFHSRCSFLLSLHPLTWEVARCHAVGSSMLGACTRSCLTLCDPRNCSPPGSSVHAIFPGKNTGVDRCLLLQGIFLTQGLNLCPLHWQANYFFFLSTEGLLLYSIVLVSAHFSMKPSGRWILTTVLLAESCGRPQMRTA